MNKMFICKVLCLTMLYQPVFGMNSSGNSIPTEQDQVSANCQCMRVNMQYESPQLTGTVEKRPSFDGVPTNEQWIVETQKDGRKVLRATNNPSLSIEVSKCNAQDKLNKKNKFNRRAEFSEEASKIVANQAYDKVHAGDVEVDTDYELKIIEEEETKFKKAIQFIMASEALQGSTVDYMNSILKDLQEQDREVFIDRIASTISDAQLSNLINIARNKKFANVVSRLTQWQNNKMQNPQ